MAGPYLDGRMTTLTIGDIFQDEAIRELMSITNKRTINRVNLATSKPRRASGGMAVAECVRHGHGTSDRWSLSGYARPTCRRIGLNESIKRTTCEDWNRVGVTEQVRYDYYPCRHRGDGDTGCVEAWALRRLIRRHAVRYDSSKLRGRHAFHATLHLWGLGAHNRINGAIYHRRRPVKTAVPVNVRRQ